MSMWLIPHHILQQNYNAFGGVLDQILLTVRTEAEGFRSSSPERRVDIMH